MMHSPSAESLLIELRKAFAYDPITGLFTNRFRLSQRAKAGDAAGSVNGEGYVHLQYRGVKFKAHRVGWAFSMGAWPKLQIDHRNGCRADNRLENLREATAEENCRNMQGHNKHGFKGVIGCPNGRFRAVIRFRGRACWLGTFKTAAEAGAAYDGAAKVLFGAFAKLNGL